MTDKECSNNYDDQAELFAYEQFMDNHVGENFNMSFDEWQEAERARDDAWNKICEKIYNDEKESE